ncbi:hypothetical protein O3M35_008925 [Rhynocoris fuscipes]|uniref:Kinase n=1 Tax=Rhynocoris fuscipes TaxID=488301 RepID=A0AAW1DAJ9_9HEMI
MEQNGPSSVPFRLVKFDNQVAGHSSRDGKNSIGIQKNNEGLIFKPISNLPAGDNEVKFYEEVGYTAGAELLLEFIPKYYGTEVVNVQGRDIKFLKLQDVTHGFQQPCIMDVKIGSQTWEPSAPKHKREAEARKYSATKIALSFCIPGYQVYDICTGTFKKVGKDEGKRLTAETLPHALNEFLNYNSGYSIFLIQHFLSYLFKLMSWWEKQTLYHIYASSLLFIYDASMLKNIKCQEIKENCLSWIKLYCIDFAHVVPANNTLDFNYISGLRKLIDLLKKLRDC